MAGYILLGILLLIVLLAAVPVLFMTLLCVLAPSMISQTSILIIPSGALALAIGYVLFKKGKL